MSNEKQSVPAEKVINKLALQNAELSRELAIREVQIEDLHNVIDRQKELLEAYEDKEKVAKNAKK